MKLKNIIVTKLNEKGIETWSYEGRELLRIDDIVMIEALFNREDTPFLGIVIKHHDRFIEAFFKDRWYNIFEIHDRDDDRLKGWYCDICKPAKISDHRISYIDLSLDLWVFPDGRQVIVDEEEFNGLDIDETTREQALNSLDDLTKNFFAIVESLPKVQE